MFGFGALYSWPPKTEFYHWDVAWRHHLDQEKKTNQDKKNNLNGWFLQIVMNYYFVLYFWKNQLKKAKSTKKNSKLWLDMLTLIDRITKQKIYPRTYIIWFISYGCVYRFSITSNHNILKYEWVECIRCDNCMCKTVSMHVGPRLLHDCVSM